MTHAGGIFTDPKDVLQQHALTYQPGGDVQPMVIYGSTLYGRSTMSKIATYLDNQNLSLVAGVNGSFFDMSTGIPYGFLVTDGVLRTSGNVNSVGFFKNGSAIIASPDLHVLLTGGAFSDTEIFYNKVLTTTNGIGLYSRDYDTATKNTVSAYNLVLKPVSGSDSELTLSGEMTLEVTKITQSAASCAIPAGGFVLSIAEQTSYASVLANMKAFKVGDRVTVSVRCADEWEDVAYACGGGDLLVEDENALENFTLDTKNEQRARTAIGIKPDGTVVIYTADESANSAGMDLYDLADMMESLGCETALNLDGGGSTTLCVTLPEDGNAGVYNTPSEGSLRAVTNHIFLVADSRPTNSVGHVYLESESTRVLPNAQVKLTATALDTNYIPMANSNVSLRADRGTIDGNILTAPASGTVTVTANAGGASAQTKIDVITQPDSISVKQNGKAVSAITLSAGETATLTASAMYRHLPVLGDNKGFTWTVQGNVGTIENGVFAASGSIGSGSVTASLGRISVTVPVTVTARALRTLDGFETSFATATGTRAMLSYNREMTRVHNGYASARLDYATGSEGNAYIGLNYAIPSNYDQLNFWVYGDNSGAQLALVTDTGSVNLGALNFSGWKLLTANLGAATAITGMIVSSDTELISAVYLDQLVLSYGGLTDTTAPKLSLQYNAASNTVTGTVKDDIDGAAIPTIHVTYDGKSYTSYTYSQSSGALSITLPAADGAQHRVNVVAGDASGNLSRAGMNAGTSSTTPAFNDMKDHWANDAVAYLKRSGISNGSNGNFLPDTNISRQEFAVLLARYLGSSQDHSSVQLPFADTNEIASWALNGAKAMYSLGIIKGSSDGSGKLYFNPTANVSRQEAVTMLGRLTEKGYAQGALKFTDSSAIQSWAAEYVSTLSEMGILTGFNDGSFRPNGAMTRAQVATVLYKF